MTRILILVLLALLLLPCLGCRGARSLGRTVARHADDLPKPRSLPRAPDVVPDVPSRLPAAPRMPGVQPGWGLRTLVYTNRNAPPSAVSPPSDPRVETPERIRVLVGNQMNAYATFENGEPVVVIGAPLIQFLEEASYHSAASLTRWQTNEQEGQEIFRTYLVTVAIGGLPGPPSVLPQEEEQAARLAEQLSRDTVLLVLSHELAHHWLGHVDRLIPKAGLSRSSVNGLDLHQRLALAASRRRESDADALAVRKMVQTCGRERAAMAIMTASLAMDALESRTGIQVPEYARSHPNWRTRGETMLALANR